MRRLRSLACLSLLGFSAQSFAGDGVVEINQACALAGCFSGDAAGFPVVIDGSAGRSYRLTSDLQVDDAALQIISIRASFVTLDLGGFTVRGLTTCSGFPPTCSPIQLAGDGIAVDLPTRASVAVRNGRVMGVGDRGVELGIYALVTNVLARENAGNGISVGLGSIVANSQAVGNRISGIAGSAGSVVTQSRALDNGLDGIACGEGCVLANDTANHNGDDGFDATNGCVLAGDTADDNGSNDMQTGDNAFECGMGCVVRDNVASNADGDEMNLGTDSAFSHNMVTGPVVGGVNAGNNYCQFAGCP